MRVESISQETELFGLKKFSTTKAVKRAVLAWFDKLTLGHLTVRDGMQVYVFGESNEEAKVSAIIDVHSDSFYSDIFFAGAVGSGESYMRGSWTSPNLVDAVRVMAMNISEMQKLNKKSALSQKLFHWLYALLTKNSVEGSRKNISAHYDLGNDFFSTFLDPTMMYSAGYWKDGVETMQQASVAKLDLICNKLQLNEDDHVVEIGTGWGGFALHAAENYGCKVTTTTISKQQYEYTLEKVKNAGLGHRITVLLKDYRELDGKYDKLVSIEMIEAVGHEYLTTFFTKCNGLLKDDGLMLIQAITISDQRYHAALKSVDFIQRYIFPGGCLPCVSVISEKVAKSTDMQLADLHDITLDYALTLEQWREAFLANLDEVEKKGFNEVFVRMWDFYLAYCEGAFRERVIQTSQFLLTKPQASFDANLIR